MSFSTGGGGSSQVSTSTDVALSSVANNQVLTYNSTTAKWNNKTTAHSSLSGLTNDDHPQYMLRSDSAAVVISATPPSDTSVVWIDTSAL
jgi:hypothetical protein